jgi:hypothetical protein
VPDYIAACALHLAAATIEWAATYPDAVFAAVPVAAAA